MSHAELTVEPESGMVFIDDRNGAELVAEFVEAGEVVVVRDRDGDSNNDETWGLHPYDSFYRGCKAGRYKPVRNDDGNVVRDGTLSQIQRLRSKYEQQDGRTAQHKVAVLTELEDTINGNVPDDYDEPVDFESVSGIGGGAASKLRAHGFRTHGDIREATDEQIQDVPYMGESNTENLREYVSNS
jgi:predicted flap endonuclease-1-like 5' DNA nuclease